MIHNPERQFRRLGIDDLIAQFRDHVRTVDLSDDLSVKPPRPREA